jgi:hypothetical protein
VISALAEAADDDPWLTELLRVLEFERQTDVGRRRWSLSVWRADGEFFHVSDARNRASINAHGLDVSRMTYPGIAGSRTPEVDGAFLSDSEFDNYFFIRMATHPVDVWAVDVSGLWMENGPTGWSLVRGAIPSSRLRLVRQDVVSQDR